MTLTFDFMTFNVLVHRLSRDQTTYQVLEKPKKICGRICRKHGLARNYLVIYSPFLDLLAEFKLLTPSALTPRRLNLCFRHSSPAP